MLRALRGMWINRVLSVSMQVKVGMFEDIISPVVLYGSE